MRTDATATPEPSENTSRRTLIAGAAWTVPVIALTAATPARAASQFVCPPVPADAEWTAIERQTGVGPYYWEGTGANRSFNYFKDSNSPTNPFQLEMRANLAVVSGRTYRVSYAIQTGDGCNPTAGTTNTNFDAFIAGTFIGGRSTKAGFGNPVQTPPPCGQGFGPAQSI
ncbi:hypothetical protein [Pseudoclavibacter helvolus]|uniref:hypothetical protein n=1 Tax=Pseudoclavibacter helvolus TaxID=255205 RepID=UPI003C7449C9